jgi:hypothetical protein
MVEKKVKSIEITPCYIEEISQEKALLVTKGKDSHGFRTVDSSPLVNFKEGDYLFRGRMVGEGFEYINYVKMNEKEIKKYFPEAKTQPEDLFSKFAGTALFPDKK